MTVFDIAFSDLRENDLVRILTREPVPAGAGARCVVTTNLDHIIQLRRRADFREAYRSAWIATIDGMPIFIYARMRGAGIAERVTGSDLFRALMPALDPHAHRCVFVAGSEETGERITDYLVARGFPASSLHVIVPPFGFEKDRGASAELADTIGAHRPTHLFFGVGSPKSEIWTYRHREAFGDCYVLNIGGALDFFAGTKKRAPAWMRRTGLEWSWRLASEPRRLARRYLVDSWGLVGAIRSDLASSRHR